MILLINTSNHFNDYVNFLKLTIYRNTFFLLVERIILTLWVLIFGQYPGPSGNEDLRPPKKLYLLVGELGLVRRNYIGMITN